MASNRVKVRNPPAGDSKYVNANVFSHGTLKFGFSGLHNTFFCSFRILNPAVVKYRNQVNAISILGLMTSWIQKIWYLIIAGEKNWTSITWLNLVMVVRYKARAKAMLFDNSFELRYIFVKLYRESRKSKDK